MNNQAILEAVLDSQNPVETAGALVELLELFQNEGGRLTRQEGHELRQLMMRASQLTDELED